MRTCRKRTCKSEHGLRLDKFTAGRLSVDTKQQMLKAIEELPDDAKVEDALERLYLLYKIDRGVQQADPGELISQEEARQRMAKWLKYSGRLRLSTILSRFVSSSLETHPPLLRCLLKERSMQPIAWRLSRVRAHGS